MAAIMRVDRAALQDSMEILVAAAEDLQYPIEEVLALHADEIARGSTYPPDVHCACGFLEGYAVALGLTVENVIRTYLAEEHASGAPQGGLSRRN